MGIAELEIMPQGISTSSSKSTTCAQIEEHFGTAHVRLVWKESYIHQRGCCLAIVVRGLVMQPFGVQCGPYQQFAWRIFNCRFTLKLLLPFTFLLHFLTHYLYRFGTLVHNSLFSPSRSLLSILFSWFPVFGLNVKLDFSSVQELLFLHLAVVSFVVFVVCLLLFFFCSSCVRSGMWERVPRS